MTPLEELVYQVLEEDNDKRLRTLLSDRLDPNMISDIQMPLLHYAVVFRAIKCLLVLLSDQRTQVNIVDGTERTALFCALHANKELLTALLAAGVDPNIQDVFGMTPLMYFADDLDVDGIIVLLLCRGIDVGLKDHKGMTAFCYAEQTYNSDKKPVCLRLLNDC